MTARTIDWQAAAKLMRWAQDNGDGGFCTGGLYQVNFV